MQLVEAVVDQRGVPAALACVLLQGAVGAQAPSLGSQPPAHPDALEAEAKQGPQGRTG